MANTEEYRSVLDDLLQQQSGLQNRLAEISSAISALQKLMPDVKLPPTAGWTPSAMNGDGKYAGMSVRDGVLALLTEEARERMTTGAIALALETGGVQPQGKNFGAKVSAVLSVMDRSYEIEANREGWAITGKGRDALSHFKASRERHAANAFQ